MENPKNNILKIVAIILAVAIVVAGVVVGLKFKDKFTSGFGAEVTTTEETIEEPTTEEQTTEVPTTEEPTTAFDTSVYDGVLNQYRKVKNDPQNSTLYYDEQYLLCADWNMLTYETCEHAYAYADINNDGSYEMIFADISQKEMNNIYSGYNILNIWKYEDGRVKAHIEDAVYGYRAVATVCKDNVLKVYEYPGGGTSVYIFYDITDAKEPVLIESIVAFNDWVDSTNVEYAHVDGEIKYGEGEISENEWVSKEEFDSIMAKYVPVTDFDWQPLN